MNEETTKERIDGLTTINFSITKCPIKVYKQFIEFCKKETNDNYSFGLKLCLEGMDANIKESLLFEQYIELRARLDELEQRLMETPEKKEKTPKTMGKKD